MKEYRVTCRDIRKSYRGYPFIDTIGVKMPDGSIKHLSKTMSYSLSKKAKQNFMSRKKIQSLHSRGK